MSETEYTPGPWCQRGEDVVDINGTLVASARYNPAGDPRFGGAPGRHGAGRPRVERLANAALIAAAPRMLAALRSIASSDGFNGGTWVGELQEIARAAIEGVDAEKVMP